MKDRLLLMYGSMCVCKHTSIIHFKIWSIITPVCTFRTGRPTLSTQWEKHGNLPKNSSHFTKLKHIETSSLHKILQSYATRLKKQASGWLFSEQTSRTLGCLLKQSRAMGGRTGKVSEAFLCLWEGIPEDQENEIGQWKGCFDKIRLKLRCFYPWLFLGTETGSFRGRHIDSAVEANRFIKKIKSLIYV